MRKKCKTCIYRGYPNGCDFILATGERRGCPASECTRYVKGKKIKLPDRVVQGNGGK